MASFKKTLFYHPLEDIFQHPRYTYYIMWKGTFPILTLASLPSNMQLGVIPHLSPLFPLDKEDSRVKAIKFFWNNPFLPSGCNPEFVTNICVRYLRNLLAKFFSSKLYCKCCIMFYQFLPLIFMLSKSILLSE